MPQCGYDGGECGSGGAHKAPPKGRARHRARPPAAEAQGSRRRCALAGLGVEADPPRRGEGLLAAVLLGAATMGVGVWRVALSRQW